MNNVRSLVRAARASANPGSGLYSDPMLVELLALHEEMIEQLRLERLDVVGSADFLTAMIDQHEKTAAMIRTRLRGGAAASAAGGAGDHPGEAGAAAARPPAGRRAQVCAGAAPSSHRQTP